MSILVPVEITFIKIQLSTCLFILWQQLTHQTIKTQIAERPLNMIKEFLATKEEWATVSAFTFWVNCSLANP